MKARKIKTRLLEYLDVFPAMAMLGPRQVGKELDAAYLDLESPADRTRGNQRCLLSHRGRC